MYELAKTLKSDTTLIDEVNIFVLTNKFYLSNKPIDLVIPGIESVNVQVWDMDRVYQLASAEQGIQDFRIDLLESYNQSLEMMHVPSLTKRAKIIILNVILALYQQSCWPECMRILHQN